MGRQRLLPASKAAKAVIEPATNTVTIPVGRVPYGVAVSPTARRRTSPTTRVSVIKPATNTVTATIPVGNSRVGVAVEPTGAAAGNVYVVNLGDDTVPVIS